jgi:Rieske 2Fe-2S family protein
VSTLQAALPGPYYVDDAHWTLERDRVMHREWVCVGRVHELGLDAPQRLAVVDVVGESVVVTSDESGRLHAFYNV